jgi:hypothetical protein
MLLEQCGCGLMGHPAPGVVVFLCGGSGLFQQSPGLHEDLAAFTRVLRPLYRGSLFMLLLVRDGGFLKLWLNLLSLCLARGGNTLAAGRGGDGTLRRLFQFSLECVELLFTALGHGAAGTKPEGAPNNNRGCESRCAPHD